MKRSENPVTDSPSKDEWNGSCDSFDRIDLVDPRYLNTLDCCGPRTESCWTDDWDSWSVRLVLGSRFVGLTPGVVDRVRLKMTVVGVDLGIRRGISHGVRVVVTYERPVGGHSRAGVSVMRTRVCLSYI